MPEKLMILAAIVVFACLWELAGIRDKKRTYKRINMQIEGFPDNELDWAEQPIIGRVLTINHSDLTDSYGKPIDNDRKYLVAKHLPTGAILIIDAELQYRRMELDQNLKLAGRLN